MAASIIGEGFQRICRDRPGAIAVRTLSTGTTTTFRDLAAECAVIERALTSLGVEPGGVVVSCLGNRAVVFSLVVACANAGLALVPLGDATDTEAAALINRAGAVAVVTNRPLPLQIVAEHPIGLGVRLVRLANPLDPPRYGASVVLKLTSGSTDLPKAAIATESHLVNDGRHVVEAMGIGPGDVNFVCIPLSHSYAIGNVVMPLLTQGTSAVLAGSFSPAQFTRDAAESGATVFPGVPFMFDRIRSLEPIACLPASLRLLITAGASIDAATVSWFRERLDRKLHSFYGSSETGGIAYDDSEDVSEPLHVGRAMPETTIVIRQSEGEPAGRIFVEGNAVASGYAHADGDSVSAFDENGFLTGDLGYRDCQDRLVLTGRVSSLVNVAGRKVDPAEVERRLRELPGITDVLVLGMSSDTRGQEVVAFLIRTDRALSPLAIRQRCAETLSAHKIPRRFVFVECFPVDARGKIDRGALRSLALTADDA